MPTKWATAAGFTPFRVGVHEIDDPLGPLGQRALGPGLPRCIRCFPEIAPSSVQAPCSVVIAYSSSVHVAASDLKPAVMLQPLPAQHHHRVEGARDAVRAGHRVHEVFGLRLPVVVQHMHAHAGSVVGDPLQTPRRSGNHAGSRSPGCRRRHHLAERVHDHERRLGRCRTVCPGGRATPGSWQDHARLGPRQVGEPRRNRLFRRATSDSVLASAGRRPPGPAGTPGR